MKNSRAQMDNFSLVAIIIIGVFLVVGLIIFFAYAKLRHNTVIYYYYNDEPPPGPTYISNQTFLLNISDQRFNETLLIEKLNNTYTNYCVPHPPYPDFGCTPGKTLNVTRDIVCVIGYSSTVRNVSSKTKELIYAIYNITNHSAETYEIDHLIPLSLGGSNDIENLWPMPSEPYPGFREKDIVERMLLEKVCDNETTLEQAQYDMVNNWTNYLVD